MRFVELGLPADLVQVLTRQGIEVPFDVQASTIPDALAGRDVAARAPTGSGKTLAFGLPILASLGRAEPRRPRGLVLAPTRELAEQIRRDLEPLAAAVGRSVLAIYGGVGFGPQVKRLARGVDLLVACPGRLQDLLDQEVLTLDGVDRVVIDEADRMADMGFLPAVQQLLDLTAPKRQTLLFSATLDNDVAVLSERYQREPVRHEVGDVEPDLSVVDHRFFATDKTTKLALAADLIEDHGSTVLFCRTRHGVDRVARQLKRAGVKTGWIHGGRTQAQRDAALSAFTTGRVAVLVATDVAARGIHVDGVACVIHYDPPADHKDYVHRSGRTARAGSGGVVVSLVNKDQQRAVARLRQSVGLPAGSPEAPPPLRPRSMEPWTDQRPSRSRVRPARNETEPPGRDETGSKGPVQAERKRAKPRRHAPTARNETGSRDHDQTEARSGRRAATGRAAAGRATAVDEVLQPDGSSDPKRTAGKAKAKPPTGKKKAKGRAKATTKRSGRPRAKDHKQRRR